MCDEENISFTTMKYTGKQLKSRLIELRNAIKRKYQIFKDGSAESDIMLERQYKPLIRELRKNAADSMDLKTEQLSVKKEGPMDYETEVESDESLDTTPLVRREFEPSVASTPQVAHASALASTPLPGDISEMVSTEGDLATTTQYIEDYFKNPVTKEYMTLFFKDATATKKAIDYVYGPYYEKKFTYDW